MSKVIIGVLFVFICGQFAGAQQIHSHGQLSRHFWIVFNPEFDEIKIDYVTGNPRTGLPAFDKLLQEYGASEVIQEMPAAHFDDRDGDVRLSHVFRVKLESGVNLRQAIKAFAGDPHIILAEPIPVARRFGKHVVEVLERISP